MRQEAFFAEPESGKATIGGALLTNYSCLYLINGNCRFESVDVILHNSRIKDNVDSWVRNFDFITGNMFAEKKLPDRGIWVSIQRTTISISCEEGKADLLTDSSGIMLLVFEFQNSIGNNNDHIVLENLVLQSVNCLHEISLSDCMFTLCLGAPQNASSSDNESETCRMSNPGGNVSCCLPAINLAIFSRRSNNQSLRLVKEMGSAMNVLTPASGSCWLLISVAVGNVFIGRPSMKNDLVQAHQLNKVLSFLSIGGEFQMISWEIQVMCLRGHINLTFFFHLTN